MKNVRFILSTLTEFPILKDPRGNLVPEVALAGRSNVGKSSLINHFFNHKRLARTSGTPGKTQLLNFFAIDEKYLLVDLPGYGFAKAPIEEIRKWSEAIDTYMESRPALKLILLLVDSRRNLSQEDQALIDWTFHKKIPLVLVLTKTDKLSREEKRDLMVKFPEAILYTIEHSDSRRHLETRIDKILWD